NHTFIMKHIIKFRIITFIISELFFFFHLILLNFLSQINFSIN
ncbi:unnamed protein product, partial [Heterotrigona itama]